MFKKATQLFAFSLLTITLSACGGGGGSSSGSTGTVPPPPTQMPPSASKSTISVSSTTVPADSKTTVAITVQLLDTNGDKISSGGATVSLSAAWNGSSDSNGIVIGPVKDNENGTYSANVAANVTETLTISFAVNGAVSSNTASVSFILPTQPADAYYVPYTAYGGTISGLWLVSATNPTATPIQVTTANMDINEDYTTFNFDGFTAFYSSTFNTATQQLLDMQPGFLVYGSGGHLYSLNLATGSIPPVPQQFSNGSYTVLCSVSSLSTGSYGITTSYVVAQVITTTGNNFLDCSTSTALTTWVIPTTATSTTAPAVLAGFDLVGKLIDTDTSVTTGVLVQNDAELDLYSPSTLTKSSALLTGLPSGASVYGLNSGSLSGTQLVAVQYIQAPNLVDDVYLVNVNGATKISSYQIPVNAPIFSDGSGGCLPYPAASPAPAISGISTGTDVVFVYPGTSIGSSGYTVYSAPLSGGVPTAIYSDSTNCFNGFDGEAASSIVLYLAAPNIAKDSPGISSDISIADVGPLTQSPVVLDSNNDPYSFTSLDFMTGNAAWILTQTIDPNTGARTAFTVTVVDVSGNLLQTYPNASIQGDFYAGVNPDGGVIRQNILINQGTITGGCLQFSTLAIINSTSFSTDSVNTGAPQCAATGGINGTLPLAVGEFGGIYGGSPTNNFYGISFGINGNSPAFIQFPPPPVNDLFLSLLPLPSGF